MLMRPPETMQNKYTAIRRKMTADYTSNQSLWQIQWTEATIDTRLEAGDTALMGEILTTTPNNQRGSYYFNQTRPFLKMLQGQQIRTRKAPMSVPKEGGDQATADQRTKLLLNIYDKEDVYGTLTDAFYQGPCVTGMNLLQIAIDWSDDPISGDIKVYNKAYNSFFIDPYFRNLDLSDCSFVWVRSYMNHSSAAALMPDFYDQIMALPGNPTGMGRDGRFQYMPEAYGQGQQNKLAYDEYYYRDYRKQKVAIDRRTGIKFDISDMERDDISMLVSKASDVLITEQMIPTVRLAIAIQDVVFYDGPNPLLIDEYPFIPVVGFYNPMMPYFYSRIQGVARSMRDPQMLLNRHIILDMDEREARATGGWIFKENAPIDVKHLFQTGAGRIIPLKEEASMDDIRPIPPTEIPAAHFQFTDMMQKQLALVSGINQEMMGMATDAKAGITEMLRQGAGLVTVEPLFENLDRAQKLLNTRVLKIAQKNYTPFKVMQILEGEQPSPFFYEDNFGKYHESLQDGFNTGTQRQMQLAQLMQLRTEVGVQIPDEWFINAATIQNKDKLLASMQQQQQMQQQMQQMQMQQQMQEQQARTNLANARAHADQGLGIERLSRVQENHALAQERKSAAIKDDFQAFLNAAKAMKEMEGVDIDSLTKLLSLMKMLENPQPSQNGSEMVDRGTTLQQT